MMRLDDLRLQKELAVVVDAGALGHRHAILGAVFRNHPLFRHFLLGNRIERAMFQLDQEVGLLVEEEVDVVEALLADADADGGPVVHLRVANQR
jgi:hypothetical protein